MTFESIKDVRSYIQSLIQEKIDSGEIVNQHWQTTEILKEYGDIRGPDSDFYILAARSWVNDEVKKAIGRYEQNPEETNEQMTLDGFEYLQKAYPIKRGNDRCLVPVEKMSYDEHMAKAQHYWRMAQGCTKHGDELAAFAESVKAAKAAQ